MPAFTLMIQPKLLMSGLESSVHVPKTSSAEPMVQRDVRRLEQTRVLSEILDVARSKVAKKEIHALPA